MPTKLLTGAGLMLLLMMPASAVETRLATVIPVPGIPDGIYAPQEVVYIGTPAQLDVYKELVVLQSEGLEAECMSKTWQMRVLYWLIYWRESKTSGDNPMRCLRDKAFYWKQLTCGLW